MIVEGTMRVKAFAGEHFVVAVAPNSSEELGRVVLSGTASHDQLTPRDQIQLANTIEAPLRFSVQPLLLRSMREASARNSIQPLDLLHTFGDGQLLGRTPPPLFRATNNQS